MRFTFQKGMILWLCLITLPLGVLIGQNPSAIIGDWQDVNNPEKKITIQKEVDQLYDGRVLQENGATQKNAKLIFKNLKWQEKSKAYKGKIINPDNEKEYSTMIYMEGENTFRFKVKVFIFSKTFRFKRINHSQNN